MAIRNIVKFGDEVLNKKCRPVERFDEKLWLLLDDMKETLEDAQGAGLAAPQVGMLRQVCVVDVGEQTGLEGCLSDPGEWGVVTRPKKVTVRAQDRNGAWFEKTGEDLCARAFCHEIDHLKGVLFTSHASRILSQDELDAMLEQEEQDSEKGE